MYIKIKFLRDRDHSVSVHHKNIQHLAIELFKVKSGIAPSLLNDIFRMRYIPDEGSVIHNLRTQNDFYNHNNPRTVRFGTETLRSLCPKVWNIIPPDIKNVTSLETFKALIKSWIPIECPCRLCKVYIAGVGFLWITNCLMISSMTYIF